MAKDTLRPSGDTAGGTEDQRKNTGGGTSSKGYAEHEVDGSDFNKFGNRITYSKLAATSFK
jgi:hypothetical protein